MFNKKEKKEKKDEAEKVEKVEPKDEAEEPVVDRSAECPNCSGQGFSGCPDICENCVGTGVVK
jgi:hypothetical protein